MSVSIPGGEFLTGSLDVISQSLTIPVLVILLIIVVIYYKPTTHHVEPSDCNVQD